MKLDADTLFALLPAFYRERDAELNGPLRALLGVIARQGALVRSRWGDEVSAEGGSRTPMPRGTGS